MAGKKNKKKTSFPTPRNETSKPPSSIATIKQTPSKVPPSQSSVQTTSMKPPPSQSVVYTTSPTSLSTIQKTSSSHPSTASRTLPLRRKTKVNFSIIFGTLSFAVTVIISGYAYRQRRQLSYKSLAKPNCFNTNGSRRENDRVADHGSDLGKDVEGQDAIYNEIGDGEYHVLFGGKELGDYHAYNLPDKKTSSTRPSAKDATADGKCSNISSGPDKGVTVNDIAPDAAGYTPLLLGSLEPTSNSDCTAVHHIISPGTNSTAGKGNLSDAAGYTPLSLSLPQHSTASTRPCNTPEIPETFPVKHDYAILEPENVAEQHQDQNRSLSQVQNTEDREEVPSKCHNDEIKPDQMETSAMKHDYAVLERENGHKHHKNQNDDFNQAHNSKGGEEIQSKSLDNERESDQLENSAEKHDYAVLERENGHKHPEDQHDGSGQRE